MRRVRGRTELPEEADEEDALETGFGQSHNIVANEDTNYVYAVGSTRDNVPAGCNG